MTGEYIQLTGAATLTGLDICDIIPPASEICLVIIAPLGCLMPKNWTDTNAFLALIDNTDTTGKYMHAITGRGTLSAQDINTAIRGTQSLCRRSFELSHVVVTNENNYALARTLERNYTGFRLWFVSLAGYLYGGSNGVTLTRSSALLAKSAEEEVTEEINLRFFWDSEGDAGRVFSPALIGVDEEQINPEIEMYRQQFLSSSSATLTWTQNSGNVPSDTTTRVWVFMQGQKLLPLQYSITPLSGPGQSTFTISSDTHYPGASYEIYTFP